MKRNHFKMLLHVFTTAYNYSNCIIYWLFYGWKITNICSKTSKIGMNLWMVYIILAIWRALESTKEGKKVKVLCTLAQNCGCTDHFRNLKGIYLVNSGTLEKYLLIQGRGNYCSKLKTGKLKTKRLLKITILYEQEPWLQNQSRPNQSSANLKLRKYVFYFPKPGNWPYGNNYIWK